LPLDTCGLITDLGYIDAVPGEQPLIPSGTVTFLFSDVVGSTRLWAADSDAMSAALRVHDEIFNETISKFHGHVFSTAGDSFAAAFARASEAVECAEVVQVALAEVDWGTWPTLTVRIGLHLGEAEERGNNYFGPTVNQAARVMAVGHGGQVVLTDAVRSAAGVSVTDVGTHTLRDIDVPVHLSQLGDVEFPPLWTVGFGIVSLPLPRTSLIGRDESVVEVRRLLGANRLVTLTGVGGCGKTRLAIEVAYREVPTHPEGVWFVDLSTISDEAALIGAFATALQLGVAADRPALDQVAAYLAPRESLMIVDNCEHMVDAVGDLLDVLLERSPNLRVLTTSRESLEIEGEYTWKIPSLPGGEGAPAVELFVERAAATGAVLGTDRETLSIVNDIVDRLDGIPLAIELAAARCRSLGVSEIRDLLDDRFSLLSGGSRRSRQRQATLEGAVQWSYDLLSDEERSMLQALSVFQGGFSTNDVASVAGTTTAKSLDLIDTLTAKSLIDVTRDASGHVRHRLLETIRLFALSRLVEAGHAVEMRNRHLTHFCADPAGDSLEFMMSKGSVFRRGLEYENFRAAATWAFERGDHAATSRIAGMIAEMAVPRGEVQIAIDAMRLEAEHDDVERAMIDTLLGWTLTVQGDPQGAESILRGAIEIGGRSLSDFHTFALEAEGSRVAVLGDIDAQFTLWQEAHHLAYEHFGPNARAQADLFWVSWHTSVFQYDKAIELSAICLRNGQDYGFIHVIEAYRAMAFLLKGSIEEARNTVARFSEVPQGSQWAHLHSLMTNTVLGHIDGPDEAARALTREMREITSRRPQITGDVLVAYAYLAHLRGEEERCAELLDNCIPFAIYAIHSALNLRAYNLLDQDQKTVLNTLRSVWTDDPAVARMARAAANSPRILAEELARWSS
jgi:predicted ATPase/class 3 adenylate cyclase